MLRIATFNIENLDDKTDSKNPSLEIRKPVLRSVLNRLDADILCLQEVHGHGNLPDHMVVSQTPLPRFRSATILNENLHDESLPFTYDLKYPESGRAAFVSEFSG